MDGWLSTSRNMVRVFVALALAVIIMLAPIFSGEYEGVDNIILTSKYGKTKCATAKVVAGIITAILTTTLIAAFNLLLAFCFYGTEGLDCSITLAIGRSLLSRFSKKKARIPWAAFSFA
ncbi:MAG: hypothetical protein ACLR8U_13670 [Oscillospiraceae bacterium]